MDFSQAEEKFRELQARVQRGEPLSEEQYQEELAKMMVQDDQGTFWSLEPGTGRWLYFNGTEWVPGTPPRTQPTAEPSATVEATSSAGKPPETPVEPDTVPTYVRSGETVSEATMDRTGAGGIPPRPIRGGTFVTGPRPQGAWLPFAIGAIVLMLCAAALFFGVRGLSFAGSSTTATPTEVAVVLPTAEPTQVPATDTPAPSPTQAPTRTPSAVTATTTDRVRVRSGPGTGFGILQTLDSGTTVNVLGRNADGKWIQIQLPGNAGTGWVSAEYVTINGDLNSVPVIQASGKPSPTTKPGLKPKPTPTETPSG